MPVCKKCKIKKKKEMFYKNMSKPKGIDVVCIQCKNEYYDSSTEEMKKWKVDYKKINEITDPLKKLKTRIRTLVSTSLRKTGYRKNSKTHQIIGCSFKEFKHHIEKQFTQGMGWGNMDKWHIDHIYPISFAKDEAEVYALNHYTNLRPLWAEDNLKKGCMHPDLFSALHPPHECDIFPTIEEPCKLH